MDNTIIFMEPISHYKIKRGELVFLIFLLHNKITKLPLRVKKLT